MRDVFRIGLVALAFSLAAACQTTPPPAPEDALVLRGETIFFTETFEGNGRTCGSCHRAEDNFAISPTFIATLPDDDPLFVAEFDPELANDFENPALMRAHALIVENQDGFDDLANDFNMRGIPHTLALRASIASREGPAHWLGR